ncbi:MAG: EamA family transporter [Candidatus Peribacteraceae bacterium]|nr:EamA family transporter [Candidatus Peribacteraceae bacterium]
MWLVFGLTAMLSFSIVNVLDSFFARDILEHPWAGSIATAISSLVVLALPLPLLWPFIHIDWPPTSIIVICLLAGVCLQLSNVLYFQALSYSEAGIVSAYWNLAPAVTALASYFIFSEQLHFVQYLGIGILIVSSVLFYVIDSNLEVKLRSFVLMVFASLLLAIMFLLEEYAFEQVPFFTGFVFIHAGMILTGIVPLSLPSIRQIVVAEVPRIAPIVRLFLTAEIFNMAALILSQKAIDIGEPARVSALETTMPGFTFLLSALLVPLIPKFGDERTFFRFFRKLGLVIAMTIGVWIMS